MNESKMTKCPGGISSLRDPQAVAAKTWVTPRSFKARRLAR